ncbi:hypothetical protein AKJ16_DCAP01989 [Drosera capensis]
MFRLGKILMLTCVFSADLDPCGHARVTGCSVGGIKASNVSKPATECPQLLCYTDVIEWAITRLLRNERPCLEAQRHDPIKFKMVFPLTKLLVIQAELNFESPGTSMLISHSRRSRNLGVSYGENYEMSCTRCLFLSKDYGPAALVTFFEAKDHSQSMLMIEAVESADLISQIVVILICFVKAFYDGCPCVNDICGEDATKGHGLPIHFFKVCVTWKQHEARLGPNPLPAPALSIKFIDRISEAMLREIPSERSGEWNNNTCASGIAKRIRIDF